MSGIDNIKQSFSIAVEDVQFHAHPILLARLYRPKGPGPFPCVVDVHGGGWGSGDRLNNAVLNEALAQSGIVVAALDFRPMQDFRLLSLTRMWEFAG